MRAAPNLKDKDKILDEMDKAQQGGAQEAQEAKAIQKAGMVAEVRETESKAALNLANAQAEGMPDQAAPMQQEPEEIPMEVQIMQAIAEIMDKKAAAHQKHAAAQKLETEAMLAPAKARHEAGLAEANFSQGIKDRDADRKIAARKTEAA
jgi:hypothetical protein